MGDMVGDKSTQESPEDVFRHGRNSPDVACCRAMALRKTCFQIANGRNGQTLIDRKIGLRALARLVWKNVVKVGERGMLDCWK